MEESESPRALMKRKAWAQSRDSWQASGSQDPGAERREDGGSSDRSKPNTIENWLSGCRTPLRASLDEQSSSSSKGLIKSGSSFEDDLSLGAEANHLPTSTSRSESSSYHTAAQAKRSQYKQKGKSMNSTGSAKSNTTVSSVSELLDLYEEDPEEVLYNLGFGTEEPDIASKIPSRFFNYPSGAHGIDIKVYLAAQIQRMELENPNYALTSRFRQTEVLATVANVFSEIYSHVSGRPMEKIGNGEAESNTQPPLKKNSSALNVARILRRNITKQNLLASGSEGGTKQTDAARTEAESGQNALTDAVQKAPQKQSKKKDSPLATVTEEGQQGPSEATLDGHVTRPLTPDLVVVNGDRSETSDPDSLVHVSVSCASDESDFTKESTLDVDERRAAATSTPDKEPSSLLPNPHVAHLLNQPRDSFEMEELQSNEDELVAAGAGRDPLLRTASQQSDSSGFAEDPSTDGSANHLKVQESYDSCDSETTVTSHAGDGSTPVSLDYPNFERLQGDEAHLQPGRGRLKSTKACEPPNTDATQHSNPFQSTTDSPHASTFGFVEPTTDPSSDTTDETKTITSDSDSIELGNINPEPSDSTFSLSAIHKKRLSLQQKSLSVDEVRPGRVWVRNGDLLRNTSERNPLRRSSSLPTSPPSPARVVTSMRIQLGRGSVKHCTPASYSYRYENEDGDEGDSIPEEEDVDGFRKQHMNVPRYRTHSSNSLYSAPADWPQRPLNEAPPWSTCSVPNLPHFTSHAHHSPPFPPHFYSPQHRVMDSRFTAVYPPPLQTTFTPPPGPHFCHPAHAAGPSYSPAPLHQHPYNLRDNPYAPHPSYSPALASHHPDASYCPPWYPTLYQMPPGAAGSAEMQLRSVLHDIRGTMQTISQGCAVPGEDVERMGTPRSVQTLYEELQLRRRSLNVFRTQMMDLELALMRQQSMVFQHLSLDDRQEAEQLQTLRTSVRHELQELELRLEERLIGLNQQMRSSIFYRHHMGFATGHRLDNLSSSSALQAMEPVTELLKEQLYLQSELGYTSALSSRASSPSRFHESPSPSPQKAGLYRSTLNLTPSAPSRPGPEAPPPAVGSPGRSLADDELSLDDGSRETEDSSLAEWKKSGGLQDLIKEIKESLARDIRQEIVNELLAAVSPGPGRNPV